MWSAYSTAKLLFLLFLVEASLGRHLRHPDPSLVRYLRHLNHSFNCIESLLTCSESKSEIIHTCLCSPKYWTPDGNVTIRWDIMNETSASYTANVTVFNYMKYHDIEGPWELKWTWVDDEILLSTVDAKSSNFTIHPNTNRITIVDLPPQSDGDDDQRIVPTRVIPWFREPNDLAKSSFSFQIDVARANLKYRLPALDVALSTPRSTYRCNHQLMKVNNTPGYLNTWSTDCSLVFPIRVVVIREI